MRSEFRIRALIARQDGKRNSVVARAGNQLVEAIGPIARAAQKTQDDELCVAKRLFDIEVDREIMLKLKNIDEPQTSCWRRQRVIGARECRQFAIGG